MKTEVCVTISFHKTVIVSSQPEDSGKIYDEARMHASNILRTLEESGWNEDEFEVIPE